MGFKLKNMFSLKGLAGLLFAAPTGGASLALTAKSAMDKQKQEKQKKQNKAQESALFEERTAQSQEAAATEARRKKKMGELEEQREKVTGFSSLIGKGDSLG